MGDEKQVLSIRTYQDEEEEAGSLMISIFIFPGRWF
jgi:hypothetical protein